MEFTPATQTHLVIGVFTFTCLALLLRRTLNGRLDLYDFLLLSMVAVIPGVFVCFSWAAAMFSEITGVKFPFVVMFGFLFLVIFIFLHRLTAQNHQLQVRCRRLVQELGLLAQRVELKLEQREGGKPADDSR